MSRVPELGPNATRAVGAAVAAGSLVLLLSYPYHMRHHYSVPATDDHSLLPFLGAFLAFVWAAAVAWGVATAIRGRLQSLTPPSAAIAVPLAPLPMAVDAHREPTTDAVPAPPRIAEWTPPSGPVEVAVRVFETTGYWRLGCVLLFVAGVAWARGQRRWLYGSALALVLYGGAHGVVTTGLLRGMVVKPLVAAVPGAVLFAVGARLAATADDEGLPSPESASEPPATSTAE